MYEIDDLRDEVDTLRNKADNVTQLLWGILLAFALLYLFP
jgi:hypothetical protein